MKISQIANSAETLLFRTRRGKIDPGEAENGLKTACHEIAYFCKTLEIQTRRGEIDPGETENGTKTPSHENFENREFGRNSFISDP